MDLLLSKMRDNNIGLSVRGLYVGAAIHADALRTTAASFGDLCDQSNITNKFASSSCLRLNSSKLELMRISKLPQPSETIVIGEQSVATSDAAACVGVWWQTNLSAAHSVAENIAKARKAFFAFSSIGAFGGELNPLSTSSIFETCVVPKLLYGLKHGCSINLV